MKQRGSHFADAIGPRSEQCLKDFKLGIEGLNPAAKAQVQQTSANDVSERLWERIDKGDAALSEVVSWILALRMDTMGIKLRRHHQPEAAYRAALDILSDDMMAVAQAQGVYNRILLMKDLARVIFGLMKAAQRDTDFETILLSMGVLLDSDWSDELTSFCIVSA